MRSYTLGELCSAAFASAGVCFSLGIMAARSAHAVPSEPPRQPEIVVYTCDNLHHAPPARQYPDEHPARYALQRLHYACQTQSEAFALATLWQQDPTAGVVLEPQPEEQQP
ncbi:hypothetical protein [Kingella oralis]|uniref:hypothetical protein n=1 Tax=Kingella oralis TaxID=505 RepID=UPI0034E42D3C